MASNRGTERLYSNLVFLEAGEEDWVIVRQLLPHETPDEIPSFIGAPQLRPLPFDCPL